MMQDINKYVEGALIAWQVDYVNRRIAWVPAQKIDATGELKDSIDGEVTNENGEVVVNVRFAEHGRYIDMKPSSISHDRWGRNAIDRLKKWVKAKGIEKFMPGYRKKRKSIPNTEALFLNNVAWGIMVNRTTGKFRRRAWYAKPTAAAVNELYNQVAAGMLDVAADNISEQLKQ